MITANQKKLINDKDEDGLRIQISILKSGHHKYKEMLIEYCESRLDGLNVEAAMVEMSDPDDMGGES